MPRRKPAGEFWVETAGGGAVLIAADTPAEALQLAEGDGYEAKRPRGRKPDPLCRYCRNLWGYCGISRGGLSCPGAY